MKKWFYKTTAVLAITTTLMIPKPARADFWGGDVVVLSQILVQAIGQLITLKQMLTTGMETYQLIQDINKGISDALGLMRTMNIGLSPGVLGQIQSSQELLQILQTYYGKTPETPESGVQNLNDQSIAEAITLHNQAFQYAAQIDPEAERIKDYSRNVSPQGAAKLTAQSLGVLIHVTNQVLRTNAAILKIISQDFAVSNKHEKMTSAHFKTQYEGLSSGFNALKSNYDLKNGR
ncbi:MAG: hypothetical protein AB7F43_01970 [Bacteriovoracia bacterium]